jgi:integrase
MGLFRRGKIWYLDYYAGARRVRERAGLSKGEADRALAIRQAEIALGKFNLVPKTSVPSFEVFAERYLNLVSAHKRGCVTERYIIRALTGFFGKRRISDFSAEDAERYKAMRSKNVQPATVNRELTVLKHMFTKAGEWKLLPSNPFRGVRCLYVTKRMERILEPDEETRLLAACDHVRSRFLRPIIVLALNTGMRRGELLSLSWRQIDLIHRTIRILTAKTGSGERTIPINTTANAVISNLARGKNSELVFPSSRRAGKRILDLKKGFKKAVQLASIPGIRFHDLRHTFATRLVQAGVDLITVQHLLRHAKISMTARYAHSPTQARIAAVERLDVFSRLQPDPNRTREADKPGNSLESKPLQLNTIGP